jgi:hypothetical protein
LLTPKRRISTLSVITLAAVILGSCGSPRTTGVENATLEEGIVAFIDGDLDRAESSFLKVTRESRSDADLQTAYLYLGRVYLAREDYVRAADALSTGKALGGDVRFDEYFEQAQRHLLTSPKRVIQLERISRGELAALVDEMFGPRLQKGRGAGVGKGDDGKSRPRGAGAADPLQELAEAGVIDVLPDGSLHAGDAVTRPAFYVIVSRLANVLNAPSNAREELFRGGYRSVARPAAADPGEARAGDYVTGREAVGTLETLERVLGDLEGE